MPAPINPPTYRKLLSELRAAEKCLRWLYSQLDIPGRYRIRALRGADRAAAVLRRAGMPL